MQKRNFDSILLRLMFFSVLIILVHSCVESYDFETRDFESVLIVEGTVTDQLEHQKIRLSRSYQLDSDTIRYEGGATLRVIAGNGEVYNFLEDSLGIYSSEIEFQAIPNEDYYLEIQTQDGEEYVSEQERIIGNAEIESLSLEKITVNENEGVAVFAKAALNDNESGYLRYTYEETSKIVSPYVADKRFVVNENGEVELQEVDYEREICYKTEESIESVIVNTELSSDNITTAVRFLDKVDEKIYFRYSILVKQFIIGKEAYNFYETLQEVSGLSNVFSQSQPGFVYGNISSINNSDNRVLGFFQVASVRSKRIFFNYTDFFPVEERPNLQNRCNLYMPYNDELREIVEEGHLEYLRDTPPELWPSGRRYELVNKGCIECNLRGTSEAPKFWEE